MKSSKTLNCHHTHDILMCWEEDPYIFIGNFVWFLSFVISFRLHVALVWALLRDLLICCSRCRTIAHFRVFLFDVQRAATDRKRPSCGHILALNRYFYAAAVHYSIPHHCILVCHTEPRWRLFILYQWTAKPRHYCCTLRLHVCARFCLYAEVALRIHTTRRCSGFVYTLSSSSYFSFVF